MWNTSISFPTSDTLTQDTSGFQTHQKTYLTGIPATRQDATRQDEILAMQKGYTADCTFACDRACYPAGAGYLIDDSDNVEYDIRRTYRPEKSNLIVLTCEVRHRGKF